MIIRIGRHACDPDPALFNHCYLSDHRRTTRRKVAFGGLSGRYRFGPDLRRDHCGLGDGKT